MTARERYKLNSHCERLLAWQIANVERELKAARDAKREKIRKLRRAWKNYKLGINRVIADNVRVYNRAILKGY